jgi:hypothetical protein
MMTLRTTMLNAYADCIKLNVSCAECHNEVYYAECRYAECHYAECRGTQSLVWKCRYSFNNVSKFCLNSSGLLLGSVCDFKTAHIRHLCRKIVHIRHLCRKTTVLNCHRYLINTSYEKINNILI